MKFKYIVQSSLGHEVHSDEMESTVETLQDNFREAERVLSNWNRRELGEDEYLYLNYSQTGATLLEQKLFDCFCVYND